MRQSLIAIFVFLVISPLTLAADMVSKAPANARAYIISPADGAIVSTSFKVQFGLENMGVAPSGVEKDKTGHHHLLINVDELPDLTRPLPATEQIRHFGGGQTEMELMLEPGSYTLQLILGNHLHIPHDPPVMSEKITVKVK